MSELHLPHLPFSVSQRTREKRLAHNLLTSVSPKKRAVALASGIAKNGGKPIYGVYSHIYSTYLRPAFTGFMYQQQCCNNPFVYWASVYGMNDVTHLGIYDIPMMSNIPNLVYLAPTTKEEYLAMLDWSIEQKRPPCCNPCTYQCCIRRQKKVTKDFSKLNEYEVTQNGSKLQSLHLAHSIR